MKDLKTELARAEHDAWRELCAALRMTGAVTAEDCEASPQAEIATPGQQVFRSIREWGHHYAYVHRYNADRSYRIAAPITEERIAEWMKNGNVPGVIMPVRNESTPVERRCYAILQAATTLYSGAHDRIDMEIAIKAVDVAIRLLGLIEGREL